MGGEAVQPGHQILDQAGIPTFAYPDTAARIFTLMWQSYYNLQALYETPAQPEDSYHATTARQQTEAILATARQQGRSILTEVESKQVLAAYGIPTVETRVATNEEEAVAAAESTGFPVVLKLHSRTITHKTDVGGVQLNLAGREAVRRAYRDIESAVSERAGAGHFEGVSVQPMVQLDGYELIVGSSLDPQFGPVLLFGMGGQLVEVFKDRALALPPLNTTLARRMMEHTRILVALRGVRGRRPVDLAALERLLVRFSDLVVEQRWIKEIEINPLLASPQRLLALDARVIVHGPDIRDSDQPRLAIRPYPAQYTTNWTAKDGSQLVLRPIRPEDEPLMVRFHGTLSERSVGLRYFHAMKLSTRVAHDRLTRICFTDYDRELVLVAERKDPQTGEHQILGVGRLSRIRGSPEAEFALLVSDHFQGKSLGTALLDRLLHIGRCEKIRRIFGWILPENSVMKRVCARLGFRLAQPVGESVVEAVIDL
jgi:acetyltransferase